MLALVTCHIFPPQSDTEKNEFLAPDFPADSSQFFSFRVHGFTSAVRQMPTAMRNLFAWTNVSSKRLFCNLATRWNKILQFVPSFPIYGWLTWWCDFFPVGSVSLWRSSTRIRPKKGSSPLDFIFDTCASASSSHLFLVGEAEHMWLYPFCKRTNVFSEKKRLFCNLSALTQNSWIRPTMSYLWMIGLEMRFFSCGPTFEDYPASIQSKKGPAPWILFLTPAPRPLQVTFLVGEAEHVCLYPFARTNAFSAKNICFVIWARVDTKFLNSSHHVLSVDDWPGDATFFLWGQPSKIIRKYSVKKGPAPWFLFLTRAPRPLEVTFFGWWSWTYVVVPLLQGQMYFQKKNACFAIWARWHKILEFVPPCPICGWLAWRCDFFPVGQPLKIIPQVFSQKKVQPLGFYFWHLRLGLFKSLFWLVKLNMYVCTLLQGQLYFQQKKHVFCNLGARWHKILEFVPSCPISGWLAWWCDFFPVGPTFEDHPQVFSQKRSSPLNFIFDTCASASWSHLFWLVKLNICVCTLLQSHVKNHTPSINHGTFFSWGLTFRYVLVNSHLIHPPSNSWRLTLGILQTYPLSESFMIDFLMPYIHRLIDQPPLNHNRQKLIFCHCTSGSFQEKQIWAFFGMIFYSWPHIMPRDPHPLSARFLENSVF